MSDTSVSEVTPTQQVDTSQQVSNTADTQSAPQSPQAQPNATPNATPEFSVPEAYKTASWAGKVKSIDDVYKQLDNLDKLAGKKAVAAIDYANAKPEEIQAYHDSLAAKDISAYGFQDINEPVAAAVGNAFKKAGLNEYQGKQMLETLMPFFVEADQKSKAEATSLEGYTKLAQEAFGENYKAQAEKVEKTLKTFAPDDATKAAFDEMPNSTRIVVDKTVAKIVESYEAKIADMVKQYGITESGAQAGANAGNVVGDIEKIRSDLRQKIYDLSSKPFATVEEKKKLTDMLTNTYRS